MQTRFARAGEDMIPARVSLALVLGLIVLRAVVAGFLPLSADEAYYWLWSKHLAAGYFDHPPAIAWLIGAGTALFGDTPFGVRLMGIVLSLPASWFVWRAAALILKDEDRISPVRAAQTGEMAVAASAAEARGGDKAALAALFFNLTLMASVELLAATPDMPSLVTSAGFVYCLARLQLSGGGLRGLAAHDADASAAAAYHRARIAPGVWWLAVGIAAGLGLLSKFSALFLGAGTLLWLILDRDARKWLVSPWPYLGAALALLIFLPNLLWQSQHHWETFAFQFARVGDGHFTLRFLGEFLAAQFGLASPLIFVLMAVGLVRATRLGSSRLMLAVLVWMGLAYFLEHSLHDRVQGNWPCFLYPALAILAADAFDTKGLWRKLSMIAAPLAAVLLLAVYAQALFQPLPLRKDPIARLLGRDFAPIGQVAAALVNSHLFGAVLTTDYETTAWLRFTQPGIKVVQLNEPQRYPDAPAATPDLLKGRLLYLTELRRDQHELVHRAFADMGFPTQLQTPSSLYMIYPVSKPRSSPLGRMP
jgi:4-amino-4-deoxy-L-arabinose transferase-like glycosyltransferase